MLLSLPVLRLMQAVFFSPLDIFYRSPTILENELPFFTELETIIYKLNVFFEEQTLSESNAQTFICIEAVKVLCKSITNDNQIRNCQSDKLQK